MWDLYGSDVEVFVLISDILGFVLGVVLLLFIIAGAVAAFITVFRENFLNK